MEDLAIIGKTARFHYSTGDLAAGNRNSLLVLGLRHNRERVEHPRLYSHRSVMDEGVMDEAQPPQ